MLLNQEKTDHVTFILFQVKTTIKLNVVGMQQDGLNNLTIILNIIFLHFQLIRKAIKHLFLYYKTYNDDDMFNSDEI